MRLGRKLALLLAAVMVMTTVAGDLSVIPARVYAAEAEGIAAEESSETEVISEENASEEVVEELPAEEADEVVSEEIPEELPEERVEEIVSEELPVIEEPIVAPEESQVEVIPEEDFEEPITEETISGNTVSDNDLAEEELLQAEHTVTYAVMRDKYGLVTPKVFTLDTYNHPGTELSGVVKGDFICYEVTAGKKYQVTLSTTLNHLEYKNWVWYGACSEDGVLSKVLSREDEYPANFYQRVIDCDTWLTYEVHDDRTFYLNGIVMGEGTEIWLPYGASVELTAKDSLNAAADVEVQAVLAKSGAAVPEALSVESARKVYLDAVDAVKGQSVKVTVKSAYVKKTLTIHCGSGAVPVLQGEDKGVISVQIGGSYTGHLSYDGMQYPTAVQPLLEIECEDNVFVVSRVSGGTDGLKVQVRAAVLPGEHEGLLCYYYSGTYRNGRFYPGEGSQKFYIGSRSGAKEDAAAVKVRSVAKTLSAPTAVKVVRTTNSTAFLNITVPEIYRNPEAEGYVSGVYVHLEAFPAGQTIPSGESFIRADQLESGVDFAVGGTQAGGEQFTIKASLVQIRDGQAAMASAVISGTESAKKSITVKTVAPSMAVSIKAKAIRTSFISGDETGVKNGYVKVASLSYNAGATEVCKNIIVEDENGNSVERAGYVDYIDQVWVTNTLKPGKYTVRATTNQLGAVPVEAKIPITVLQPITNITPDQSAVQLYKPAGKAASYKGTFSYKQDKAPDVPKVNYTVSAVDFSILGFLSVDKNGKVTVAKGYTVPEQGITVSVYIEAADRKLKADVDAVHGCYQIKVMPTPQTVTNILWRDRYAENSYLHANLVSGYYRNTNFTAYDQNKQRMNVTWSCDRKDLKINPTTGVIEEVNGSGIFTIKATAMDGGKSSKTFRISVGEAPRISRFDAILHTSSGGTSWFSFSDEGNGIYQAEYAYGQRIDEYLEVYAGVAGKDNDYCTVSSKITVSGGKIIKLDKTDDGFDHFYIKPTSNKITVNLYDGKERLGTYIINLPGYCAKASVKLAGAKAQIIGGPKVENTEITLKFSGCAPEKKYNVQIFKDVTDKTNNTADYDQIINAIKNGKNLGDLSEGSVSLLLQSGNNLPVGTYKLHMHVSDCTDPGNYITVAEDLVYTLTVKAAPKAAPVFNAKVTMTKEPGSMTELYNAAKSKNCSVVPVRVYNNNAKGKINKFGFYFETSGTSLRVKDGFSLQNITAEDLTGWIEYQIYDINNQYVGSKTVKVTVAFQ